MCVVEEEVCDFSSVQLYLLKTVTLCSGTKDEKEKERWEKKDLFIPVVGVTRKFSMARRYLLITLSLRVCGFF
jgi:hypothetical protein